MEFFVGTPIVDKSKFYVRFNMNSGDAVIATLLKMEVEEYRQFLIRDFNASTFYGEVYFKTKEDAEKAAEWIESAYILGKLRSI